MSKFKDFFKITSLSAIIISAGPLAYQGVMYHQTAREIKHLSPKEKEKYATHLIHKYYNLDVLDKVGTYGAYVAAKDYYSSKIIDN